MGKSAEKRSLLVPMDCVVGRYTSSDEEFFDADEELGLDDPTEPTTQHCAYFRATCSNVVRGEATGYSRKFWFYFSTSATLAPPTMFLWCLLVLALEGISLEAMFDPKEPYLEWVIAAPMATFLLTVLSYALAYLHITYSPIEEDPLSVDVKPHPLLRY